MGDIGQLRQGQAADQGDEEGGRRPLPAADPAERQGRCDEGGDEQRPSQHEGDERRGRLEPDGQDKA